MPWLMGGLFLVLRLLGSEWWVRFSFEFCIKFLFLNFEFFFHNKAGGVEREREKGGDIIDLYS